MKCLQNVEFDDLFSLGCIYPRLVMDNTAVSAVRLMGAGKLRAGVRVRALNDSNVMMLLQIILIQLRPIVPTDE